MKCINCGYHLKKTEEVCPYCETRVEDMLPPPRQATPAGKEPAPAPTQRPEEDDARRRAAEYARKEAEAAARKKWGEEYDRRRQRSERDSAGRMKRNFFLALLAAAVIYMVVVSVIYNNEYQDKRASQSAASSRAYAMSVKESKTIDETKEMKGLGITVQKVQRLSSYEGKKPCDGMEYVAVTLTVKNTGNLFSRIVDFKDFALLDVRGNGRGYDRIEGKENELLAMGESCTGVLVFAVPANTASTLLYRPNPLGEKMMVPLF